MAWISRPLLFLLVALVAACTGIDSDGAESSAALPDPGATAVVLVPGPRVAPVEIASAPQLSVRYSDCLLEQGFDAEGVQVLVGSTGVPWWVKTGHNVPGGLHGYCFEVIGGAPTYSTSYGVPIEPPGLIDTYLQCGRVRIDQWDLDLDDYPEYGGDLPEPIIEGLGVSPEPDGQWLEGVIWREVTQSNDRLLVLGERARHQAPTTRFVYADLAYDDDGGWLGSAWGNCDLQLHAQGWDPAIIELDLAQPSTPDSTTLELVAQETACASGKAPDHRRVAPVVRETAEAVYVVVFVQTRWFSENTCQDNPTFSVQVQLRETLGERTLLDISNHPHALLEAAN